MDNVDPIMNVIMMKGGILLLNTVRLVIIGWNIMMEAANPIIVSLLDT